MNKKIMKNQIKELSKKISKLKTEKRDLEEKLIELTTGYKKGDIAEYEGAKYKLTNTFCDMWWVGQKILKDGSLSKRRYNLYNLKINID